MESSEAVYNHYVISNLSIGFTLIHKAEMKSKYYNHIKK